MPLEMYTSQTALQNGEYGCSHWSEWISLQYPCGVSNESKTTTRKLASAWRAVDKTAYRLTEWRDLIAKGSCATTPLNAVYKRRVPFPGPGECYWAWDLSTGTCKAKKPARRVECRGVLAPINGSPYTFPTHDFSEAVNLAAEQFITRARNIQTAFAGGVFLGELRESLRMLRDPGKRLRKTVRDLRDPIKDNLRKARLKRDLASVAQDTWLEYAFGVRPLVNDILDGMSALNQHSHHLRQTLVGCRGKGVSAASYDHSEGGATLGSSPANRSLYYKETSFAEVRHRFYGALRCNVESPLEADLSFYGTSWQDVLPTAYELVPYSWLVDYFSNLGKMIDAWSWQTSSLAWLSSVNVKTLRRFTYGLRLSPVTAGFVETAVSLQPGGELMEDRTIIRTPQADVGALVPDFRFQLPGFATQWINLTAIAADGESIYAYYRELKDQTKARERELWQWRRSFRRR